MELSEARAWCDRMHDIAAGSVHRLSRYEARNLDAIRKKLGWGPLSGWHNGSQIVDEVIGDDGEVQPAIAARILELASRI